jgi:hypothetical protein
VEAVCGAKNDINPVSLEGFQYGSVHLGPQSVYKQRHEKCRALLVSRKGGALSSLSVALSHFTLCCSGIDSAEETVMNVRVCHLVTADRVVVRGGGGFSVFYIKPLTPLRYVNLFNQLPLQCSAISMT